MNGYPNGTQNLPPTQNQQPQQNQYQNSNNPYNGYSNMNYSNFNYNNHYTNANNNQMSSQQHKPDQINYQSFPQQSYTQNQPQAFNSLNDNSVQSHYLSKPNVNPNYTNNQITQSYNNSPIPQNYSNNQTSQNYMTNQLANNTNQNLTANNQQTDISNQMNNINLNSVNNSEPVVDLFQCKSLFTNNLQEEMSYHPKTHYTTRCDPSMIQCTLNALPVDGNLLQKSRLPLGFHIQPFRDISETVVVNTSTIVRCKSCRTYINPFVTLNDHQRRWNCNICGKLNDLANEFMYDPSTSAYCSPLKRPELQHCNIEYIANSEYASRAPVASCYVFCLDVSKPALDTNYLPHLTKLIADSLQDIPGDSRAQICFITYNSSVHFYQIQEHQYSQLIWPDLDSPAEIPCALEDLLVPLKDRREILAEFLECLPEMHQGSQDIGNCMGYVLQVAVEIMKMNGAGRLTFINGSLPNSGPGSLKGRLSGSKPLNPLSQRPDDVKAMLQPGSDFYKTWAMQCVELQISVDLFCISSNAQQTYTDIATISQLSQHSTGAFYHYPYLNINTTEPDPNPPNPQQPGIPYNPVNLIDADRFLRDFRRYITRDIGFEAVMRIRCTRDLEITAFHGNAFQRSVDVIAMPVVNPDASYAVQLRHANSLSEWTYVIIQAALLYTTSNSERRIRVNTFCAPVTTRLEQVFDQANGPAIAGLVAKLALNRCFTDDMSNIREAFVNALADPLRAYNLNMSHINRGYASRALLISYRLRLLVPFIMGLLRNPAFRVSNNPKLMNSKQLYSSSFVSIDERAATIEYLRSLPLNDILRMIYPCMISINEIAENIPLACLTGDNSETEDNFQRPIRLNLSNSVLSRDGVYLIDTGSVVYLLLNSAVPQTLLRYLWNTNVNACELLSDKFYVDYDVSSSSASPTNSSGQHHDNDVNEKPDSQMNVVCRRILQLISEMTNERQLGTTIMSIGAQNSTSGQLRTRVLHHLIEDKMEDSMSYYEFLSSIQTAVHST